MTRLLLVTGELAEGQVRDVAKVLSADVLAIPVSVAQFMSVKMAADGIKKLGKKYEKILFPGLTRFDVSLVEKEVDMPCFKGPVHPSDLPGVLDKKIKLSKTEPADSLVAKKGSLDYKKLVEEAEKKEAHFKIGQLKIGPSFPPRIIAEIVDAPLLTPKQALKRAQYYLDSGADIIDVGAIAAEDNSEKLCNIVKHLKSNLDVPISIDSLKPNEINAGLSAGADLVLSLHGSNIYEIKRKDATYVVIPDKENGLQENLKLAKESGFKNLISDPILSPPFRAAESISKYSDFRKKNPKEPIMLGVGNIVELIDADSVGMNAMLASIAVELGNSLLLTTENSDKTRGSVRELSRAVELSFLAKGKGTLPKDLGIDVFLAKAKSKGLKYAGIRTKTIKVPKKIPSFSPDVKGHFEIFIDFEHGSIIVSHPKSGAVFEGPCAESISKKILEQGIVSNLEHAAYLGRELQKAEICLRLKRGYVQDEEFLGL